MDTTSQRLSSSTGCCGNELRYSYGAAASRRPVAERLAGQGLIHVASSPRQLAPVEHAPLPVTYCGLQQMNMRFAPVDVRS